MKPLRRAVGYLAVITAVVAVFAVVGVALVRDADTSISSQAVAPLTAVESTNPDIPVPEPSVSETTIPSDQASASDQASDSSPVTTVPETVEVCSTNLGCQSIGLSPTTLPNDCYRVVGEHAPGFFSTVLSPCPDPLPDVTFCTAPLDDEGQSIDEQRHCARQYDRLSSTTTED